MMRRVPFLMLFLSSCLPTGYDGAPPQPEQHGLVRALHIARGAPPLNVTYDDGKPMASSVRFGGITKSVDMPIGDHDFDVVLRNAAVARSDKLALAANQDWSVFMWGDTTEMHASLLDDGPGLHGVRVIHAMPHQQDLRATLNSSALHLEAGQASGLFDVTDATLSIDLDGDGAPDATFTLTKLDNSGVTDLYVVPAATPGTVSVMACTSSNLTEIPADGPLPPAQVRALHLSPDAPDVDVFVDGSAAFTDLAFTHVTPFASLAPALIDVDVAPAGAGVGSAVLSVHGLELLSKHNYTAVAFGDVARIQALAIDEDIAPVGAGKIRVRAIHAADGVGPVDVVALDANAPLDAPAVATVFTQLPFGQASNAVEIDAAATRIGLDLNGDHVAEVAFDIPALPAGTIADLFAVATASGVSLVATTQDQTALVINAVPPAPPASVRVVHLSPDAPAVDVTAAGAVLASDLSFENATGFASVSSGTVDVDIALASNPSSPVLSVTNLNLAPSSFTTAVAFGRASDLHALAIDEDRTPPAAGDIRVRAVHTAVGVGDVDVYAVTADGNIKLYDNLAFGTAGDTVELPAGAYTIGLDLDEDANPDLVFTLPHLAAGTIANLFAVTDAAGKASIAVER